MVHDMVLNQALKVLIGAFDKEEEYKTLKQEVKLNNCNLLEHYLNWKIHHLLWTKESLIP